jgi:hypothetical protein
MTQMAFMSVTSEIRCPVRYPDAARFACKIYGVALGTRCYICT